MNLAYGLSGTSAAFKNTDLTNSRLCNLNTSVKTDLVSGINSHLAEDATTDDKGHMQLQTTVDTSESKALTPKALNNHLADFANNRCIVSNNVNQAIADSTLTTLEMNTEIVDGNDMHDTETNNSRITIKKAGTYIISADVMFDINVTGVRRL